MAVIFSGVTVSCTSWGSAFKVHLRSVSIHSRYCIDHWRLCSVVGLLLDLLFRLVGLFFLRRIWIIRYFPITSFKLCIISTIISSEWSWRVSLAQILSLLKLFSYIFEPKSICWSVSKMILNFQRFLSLICCLAIKRFKLLFILFLVIVLIRAQFVNHRVYGSFWGSLIFSCLHLFF